MSVYSTHKINNVVLQADILNNIELFIKIFCFDFFIMAIKKDVEAFGNPTDDDIDKFTSKRLEGVAYQLDLNNDDGYGVFARKCAAMIIRRMADCLQDNEIIADFAKKSK